MSSTTSTLLQSLLHPSELISLVQYAVQQKQQQKQQQQQQKQQQQQQQQDGSSSWLSYCRSSSSSTQPLLEDEGHVPDPLSQCYYYLNRTSRSFATVIQALDPKLRDAVCLFYLILRGLDTIEDDMTIPLHRKLQVLRSFSSCLYLRGWSFTENCIHDKDRDLLVEFHFVIDQFLLLPHEFQLVISDITSQMANGMADYCLRAYEHDDFTGGIHSEDSSLQSIDVLRSGNRVLTIKEYNQYCHFVAGLVGHGLTRLFLASGLESSPLLVANDLFLANSMGLFLQKVNITRDFVDDYHENRVFWPREIWNYYASDLSDLLDSSDQFAKGRATLNHMVTNALTHVPDVLHYLDALTDQSVFRFCAIPQVMAIATLALLYNNPNVIRGNVKIRKGLAVHLIMKASNMMAVRGIFAQFITDIRNEALTYREQLLTNHPLQLDLNRSCSSSHSMAVSLVQDTITLCEDSLSLCQATQPNQNSLDPSSVTRSLFKSPHQARLALGLVAVPIVSWFMYKSFTQRKG